MPQGNADDLVPGEVLLHMFFDQFDGAICNPLLPLSFIGGILNAVEEEAAYVAGD